MSNLATITNNILADSGIDDINVVVTTGSYTNPSWIVSLPWTKITGTPTTLAGYGITDAYTQTQVNTLLSGYVPVGRTITINGTTFDLSANRTFNVGTVTSVGLSAPTGFSVANSPVTGAGTLALSFASGFSLPTNASQANWDAAYNDKINSAAVTGTTTKTLTLTQQDGGTITASWTDINTDAVTSVFGRTGAVVAANGDYTTAQVTESGNLYFTNARAIASVLTGYTSGAGTISAADTILSAIQKLNGNIGALTTGVSSVNGKTGVVTLITTDIAEGTNLYFTQARVSANTDVAANTAARHNAVTLGTANGLSLSTQQLSLGLASSSANGALSSTDWTTFNNKQNALTNPVTGTGTTNYLPKFTGASTIGNSQVFDNGTNVGIGTNTPTNFTPFGFGPNIEVSGAAGGGFVSSNSDSSVKMIMQVNASTGGTLKTLTNHSLLFATNDVVRMALFNDGNVSISNSPSNAGFKLDVNGTGRFSGQLSVAGGSSQSWAGGFSMINIGIGQTSVGAFYNSIAPTQRDFRVFNAMYFDGTNYRYNTTGTVASMFIVGNGGDGGINLFNGPSGTSGNTVSLTNIFSVSSTGQGFFNDSVGIGTNSPDSVTNFKNLTINGTSGSFVSMRTNNTLTYRVGTNSNEGYLLTSGAIPLVFYTNTTERMRIFSDGNVFIGSSPSNAGFRFQVNGEGRFYQSATNSTAYLRVENNRSRNAALRLTTTVGDYYLGVGIGADVNQFQIFDGIAGATRLTIASTGAATFSSTAQDCFTINTTNSDGPVVRIQNSGTNIGLFGNAEGVTNGGVTNFAVRATNNLIFSTGGANPRMTILSGGNVGIGTASPTDTIGYGRALDIQSSTGAVIYLRDSDAPTTQYGFIAYDGNDNGLKLNNENSSGFIRFNTAGTERMRIFSDGNVFIGSSVSNNGQRLRVNGNIEVTASNAFRASYDNSDSYHGALTWATLQLGNNGNNRIIGGRTAAGGFLQFYVNTTNDCTNYATVPNGTLALTLASTGAATFSSSVTAGGDVIAFSSSDRRLKDNLTRIESSLEKVGKLSGYSFDWNSNQETYSGKDYGVVAQEVEAIFPELVKTRDNGYKAVKYEKLIPVLIEAIKELNEKVEKLK